MRPADQSSPPSQLISLADYEREADEATDPGAFGYYSGESATGRAAAAPNGLELDRSLVLAPRW